MRAAGAERKEEAAPNELNASRVCSTQQLMIQDWSDRVETTGFGFMDAVFLEASGAISNASFTVNQVSFIRERITAVSAATQGALMLEMVTTVESGPVVSIVSLAGEKKTVVATIGAEGGEGLGELAEMGCAGAKVHARRVAETLAAVLKAAKAKVTKAGPVLMFKATASCWLSLGGYEGRLEAPPVSVMEARDGATLGLISLAQLKERRRQRLIAKGTIKESAEAKNDDDDDLDEDDLDEDELTAAEKASDETSLSSPDKKTTSLKERVAANATAAQAAAAAAASVVKQQAAALAEQATTLSEQASKYTAFYSDPEEMRHFYHEARLRLKLRSAQAKANAEVIEQLRSCALELYEFNQALAVLAYQLRAPVVGEAYSFRAAVQQLRSIIDAESVRQTGHRASIERKMDLSRVQAKASPLLLTLKGWDGTSCEGKPPIGTGAAEAIALLFGPDGVSQALLPDLAVSSSLAAAKTANAFNKLTFLVTSCMPGSDLKLGLPTPRILRLMALDVGVAGMSGPEARAKMRRVPTTLRVSVLRCVDIAPWLGETFSTTLRAFCMELRAALKEEGESQATEEPEEPLDEVGATYYASKSGALAKAIEAMPKELADGDVTA